MKSKKAASAAGLDACKTVSAIGQVMMRAGYEVKFESKDGKECISKGEEFPKKREDFEKFFEYEMHTGGNERDRVVVEGTIVSTGTLSQIKGPPSSNLIRYLQRTR